jgi:hypothetical protein
MHNADATADAEEWVIWNGGHGLVTTATLGHVEAGPGGRKAWLDEPFDMVGPFNLDELVTRGRIVFAACIVMSRQRWQDDQADLRRASLNMRRTTQQGMNDEFARFSGRQGGNHSKPQPWTSGNTARRWNSRPTESLNEIRSMPHFGASPRRHIQTPAAVTNSLYG